MTGRRRAWLLLAAVALVVLVVATFAARTHAVPSPEVAVFRTVNDAPAWLYQALWPFMQLGNVAVAATVAVAFGIACRRWYVALAGAAAVVVAWYGAKAVKAMVGRGRPAALLDGVRLPGASEDGAGFISGHSTVAFALATIVAGALPRRWRPLPFVLATLVALARVFVGVHLPLDVLGGAAAGVMVGSLVNVALTFTSTGEGGQSEATSPTGQATPVPPSPQ